MILGISKGDFCARGDVKNFEDATPELRPTSQTFCVLTGIVWPILCFAISSNGLPGGGPRWQSGKWIEIIGMSLGGWPSWSFYQILAYSMICLGTFIRWEKWAGNQLWVCVGIYGGFLLAMQFGVLLGMVITSLNPGLIVYCLIGSAVTTVPVLITFRGRTKPRAVALGLPWLQTISAIVVGVVVVATLPYLMLLALAFAPWITSAAFAIASVQLLKTSAESRFSIKALLVAMTWLSGLAATWRLAWVRALAIYSQLPTEPPQGCFVVTAAAHGHVWLVGSRRAGNTGRLVNRQLVRIKTLELVIQAVCPKLHRRLRAAYNVVGPPVARQLKNRFLADVMYLLLKPVELAAWLTGLVLRLGNEE